MKPAHRLTAYHGAMFEDDDTPRRTDARTKLVAIVLILCLIAGAAPFLMNLIF